MAPLFPGCDYEHWLIVIDKPGSQDATKKEMIDCYLQTAAKSSAARKKRKRRYTMCHVRGISVSASTLMRRPPTSLKVCPEFFLCFPTHMLMLRIKTMVGAELAADEGKSAAALAACRTLAEEISEFQFPAPQILSFKINEQPLCLLLG